MRHNPRAKRLRLARKISRKTPDNHWYAEQLAYYYRCDEEREIACYLLNANESDLDWVDEKILRRLNELRNDTCLQDRIRDAMLWRTACTKPECRDSALQLLRELSVSKNFFTYWLHDNLWYRFPRTDLSIALHRETFGWTPDKWERLHLACMTLSIESWMNDESRRWHHTERSMKTWKHRVHRALEVRDIQDISFYKTMSVIFRAINDPRSLEEFKASYKGIIKPYRKLKRWHEKIHDMAEALRLEKLEKRKEEQLVSACIPIETKTTTYTPFNLPEGSMMISCVREELGCRVSYITKENANVTKFIPIKGSLTYEI